MTTVKEIYENCVPMEHYLVDEMGVKRLFLGTRGAKTEGMFPATVHTDAIIPEGEKQYSDEWTDVLIANWTIEAVEPGEGGYYENYLLRMCETMKKLIKLYDLREKLTTYDTGWGLKFADDQGDEVMTIYLEYHLNITAPISRGEQWDREWELCKRLTKKLTANHNRRIQRLAKKEAV